MTVMVGAIISVYWHIFLYDPISGPLGYSAKCNDVIVHFSAFGSSDPRSLRSLCIKYLPMNQLVSRIHRGH